MEFINNNIIDKIIILEINDQKEKEKNLTTPEEYAKFVTFIEKNRLALDILKKNLNDLSLNNQAQVISGTIENFLKLKQIPLFETFIPLLPSTNINRQVYADCLLYTFVIIKTLR